MPRTNGPKPVCSTIDCSNEARSHKLGAICMTCYQRTRRVQEQLSGDQIESETIDNGRKVDASTEDLENALDALKKLLATSGADDTARRQITDLEREMQLLEQRIDARLSSVFAFERHKENGEIEIDVDMCHYKMPFIAHVLAQGVNVVLVGPAGSGKTTMGFQIAEHALHRPFRMCSALLTKFEVTGFITATGTYVPSALRESFELGYLFLQDEWDASEAKACVALNAILENGHADFPDGTVKRHKDFVVLAAANTYGSGANPEYIGRNALDAATKDRFFNVALDYDERLEAAIAGVPYMGSNEDNEKFDWKHSYTGEMIETACASYVARVQAWRHKKDSLNIKHIISPRASIKGCDLIRSGIAVEQVEKGLVWKGLEAMQINAIKAGG